MHRIIIWGFVTNFTSPSNFLLRDGEEGNGWSQSKIQFSAPALKNHRNHCFFHCNFIIILKITMRKLEVFYSMYPTIKLDEKIFAIGSFFENRSRTDVTPHSDCKKDPQENMNHVSILFACLNPAYYTHHHHPWESRVLPLLDHLRS